MITIFKDIFATEPHYIEVDVALSRIKNGKSKVLVEQIRESQDKEKRDSLKKRLPCVCFSGTFRKRLDSELIEHSHYIVLDFDKINPEELISEIACNSFVKAAWVSPSGDGVKVLCRVATTNHRGHFEALKVLFPQCDKSGINESRVCYESYDPNIYIRENPTEFDGLISNETSQAKEFSAIENLVTWLAKSNKYFVSGERNVFIFTLACACCRYGVDIEDCKSYCFYEFFQKSTDFSKREGDKAIESAYRSEKANFGTVKFDKGELVDSKGKEAQFEVEEGKIKDVIYLEDAEQDLDRIIENGYESIKGIGIQEMDTAFIPKRGQSNLLTGYGNQGKSTFGKWHLVVRSIIFDEKYAFFSPEEDGADGFYLSLMEIYLGGGLAGNKRFSKEKIKEAKDFIKSHFFYIFPEELSPTPQYIKERFLKLIITEKVDGVVIDPFNQLTNDYKGFGGRDDKYLESFLSDFNRFIKINDVFGWIVAHPSKPQKNSTGTYDAPTEYDLAGGAMWNNKMFNILAYHRPDSWTDPSSPHCQLYGRKIKLNRINGTRGLCTDFEYNFAKRRFLFGGKDVLDFLDKRESLSDNFQKNSENDLQILNNIANFESENKDFLDVPF